MSIVCPKQETCIKTINGLRCPDNECVGDNLVYACKEDSDCNTDQSPTAGSCVKYFGKTEDNSKFKYFQKVGYCTTTTKSKNDPNCTEKQYIGEIKDSSGEAQIKICGSGQTGISEFNTQCEGSTVSACALDGLCPNNWEAIPFNDITTCSSATIPTVAGNWECCSSDSKQAKTPDGSKEFCCPFDTSTDKQCTLNTKNPYSAKILTANGKIGDAVTCTANGDLSAFEAKLYDSLGITTDLDKEYVGLYCDEGKIKAYCGLVDVAPNLDPEIGDQKYGVINTTDAEQNPYSYCFPKYQNQLANITWQYADQGQGPLSSPLCKSGTAATGTDADVLPLMWTTADDTDYGYIATGEAAIVDRKGQPVVSIDPQACLLALGESQYGINDVTVQPNALGQEVCKFTLVCDNYLLTNPDSTNSSVVKWKDLNNTSVLASDASTIFTGNNKIIDLPLEPVSGKPSLHYNGLECAGRSDFDKSITQSPYSYNTHAQACYWANTPKLHPNGKYCENGVNIKTPTECSP